MVIVCATPAVCVAAPVITSCVAAPAVTVTVAGLPLTAVPPIVTPIVGEPTVAGAVYVAVHTPLTHVNVPIEPALGVATKTADVAPVRMLPNASFTVTVTVAAPLGPRAVGLTDSVDVVALAAAPLTTTLSRFPPVALSVPSVVATTAVSTVDRIIDPVATPLANVRLVLVPNAVPATVGLVLFGDTAAPLNVRLFAPVYVVAALPLASRAVTVIVCATPAVCVPLPVMTNCVAAPAVGVMLCVAEARPPLANVNVYAVPAVPLMPTPLNVAMPETAATVVVPSVVAPMLTVIVTEALLAVTTLPDPSLIATTGCVVNAAPLAEPAALVVNASCVAEPAITVTVAGLPLTAVPPTVTPIVGELVVAGAVYVAVQTPLTQVNAPIEPALGVVAPVMMLPKASFTVTVTVAVPLGPTLAGLTDSVVVVAFAAAALTTTLRRLPPVALSVPSVVATIAVSTVDRIIDPVATPLANVRLVLVPNAVPATVGFVLFGETDAPLNVRLFAPVYVVAVLPLAS
jgi:hypothetical protein